MMISNQPDPFLEAPTILPNHFESRSLATIANLEAFIHRPFNLSTQVVSGVGAFVACSTLALIAITLYMGYLVYFLGRRQDRKEVPVAKA